MSTTDREQLLRYLADAVDDKDTARLIRNVVKASPEQVVAVLSGIERTPGIPTTLWDAIVTFKAWMGNRATRDDVVVAIFKIPGLV